ncbi:ATP phosphoribosyltransferase regulatory subunit [Ferviditalea candida]|uniref:ATP phosphoribosyltransferase regulatory subunit n=1 Tax=Ferviditalea candida TaxID=3108399 RepID=A0ABU5ZP66_9BACL|nr:ATP phosphoribosyltransferase regulatory subunit [Paenibacillaceae bacterium T2]
MSQPKVFEKPTGVRDYLPEAVAKLRSIELRVLECMQRWGYQQIMTPTLEYYDTVGIASSTSNNRLFKLLDNKGTMLVMRSDMTAPIARVVASLLKDKPFPVRLSYHSNVFRAIEEEAGREAEFFQTGVELVGDASPEADAEIVALAIASLKAAGVEQFKIALGHAGFLNGLFDQTLPGRHEEQTALKECLQNRDYVGFRYHLQQLHLDDEAREELESILRLRGGVEICRMADKITHADMAKESLRHLCEVWEILKAYKVDRHVMIDLTMIGNFAYYTGMIMEGYAENLGFPVLNGGRYDNLLAQFGRPAPATGFALETNRIMQVVNGGVEPEAYRVLVLYSQEKREEAIRTALELRTREGYMVETKSVSAGEAIGETGLSEGERVAYEGQLYDDIIQFTE